MESDSHSDTRNLISYWILLSLIYLFEYAFHMLLQWFRYWAYIKLMIIVWLMIPDFGRASYVYNCLVYSCISMNPQEVISRFRNSKKENFLMQTEKYITENGSEALEKLIASKNKTAQNLDAEGMKAVLATEKNEMQQKDIKDLEIEKKEVPESKQVRNFLKAKQKDIKDLEIEKKEVPESKQVRKFLQAKQKDIKDLEIEKKEVPEGKQVRNFLKAKQGNTAATNDELNVDISSATVQIEGTAGKVTADKEFLKSCASKKVQQEWTCAMCQVTTSCEDNLRSHLRGRKHKATFEALKAKNQQPGKMKDIDNTGKGRGRNDDKAAKFCDYCNTPGHVRETCFHLNGYPACYQMENANMAKTETSKMPFDFTYDWGQSPANWMGFDLAYDLGQSPAHWMGYNANMAKTETSKMPFDFRYDWGQSQANWMGYNKN